MQYRNCLQEINGNVESRIRLPHIEFSYVRQLQQDNSELRSLLEEHQAALQMIMTKYREQVMLIYVPLHPVGHPFLFSRLVISWLMILKRGMSVLMMDSLARLVVIPCSGCFIVVCDM